MRVHPSNFQIDGIHRTSYLKALSAYAVWQRSFRSTKTSAVAVWSILRALGIDEPLATESLQAGVNLISFSCDKLLGGPQAGVIAGDEALVQRVRRNPMYRAFRVDKLILQSLEATLRASLQQDWQSIPALRMILARPEELRQRAEQIVSRLVGLPVQVRESESAIGGGSTPDQTLPTWVVELSSGSPSALEQRLRTGEPPVICRIQHDRIIFDMRTLSNEESAPLISAIRAAAMC